jgi:hypothetical protein
MQREPGGNDRSVCERRQNGEPSKRVGVVRLCGTQQRFRLVLQLFEIWTGRKLARRHTTPMLKPVVRRQAARRCMCPESIGATGGLALRANPLAPCERSLGA